MGSSSHGNLVLLAIEHVNYYQLIEVPVFNIQHLLTPPLYHNLLSYLCIFVSVDCPSVLLHTLLYARKLESEIRLELNTDWTEHRRGP